MYACMSDILFSGKQAYENNLNFTKVLHICDVYINVI